MADVTFKSNADNVKKNMHAAMVNALEMMGHRYVGLSTREITDLGVVDTGYLRSTTGFEVNDAQKILTVGVAASYAINNELGWNSKGPRPFVRNSVLNYPDEYRDAAAEAIADQMGG